MDELLSKENLEWRERAGAFAKKYIAPVAVELPSKAGERNFPESGEGFFFGPPPRLEVPAADLRAFDLALRISYE